MSSGGVVVRVEKNRFKAISGQISRNLAALVATTVYALEADVKGRIESNGQVDTGNMVGSVAGRMTGTHEGEVNAGANYSPYQNYGTRFMAGRPFMEPSADLRRPKFVAEAKAVLKNASH